MAADEAKEHGLRLLAKALAAPPKLPESACDVSLHTLTSSITWLVSAVHVLESNIAGQHSADASQHGLRLDDDRVEDEQHNAEMSKALAAQLSKLEVSFDAQQRAQVESSSAVNEMQEHIDSYSAKSGQLDNQFEEAIAALDQFSEWSKEPTAEEEGISTSLGETQLTQDLGGISEMSDVEEDGPRSPDGKKKSKRKPPNYGLKSLNVSRNFLDLKNQRHIQSLGRDHQGLCEALEKFEIAVKNELRHLAQHINSKSSELVTRKELQNCTSALESKLVGCTSAFEAKQQQSERSWQCKLEAAISAWHSKVEKMRKAQAASDAFRDEKWDERFSAELCSLREQIRKAEHKALQVQSMLPPAFESSSAPVMQSPHRDLSVRVERIEKKLSTKPVTLESLAQVDLAEEVQRLRRMVECMQHAQPVEMQTTANFFNEVGQDEHAHDLRQNIDDQSNQELRIILEKRFEEQQKETSALLRNCERQISHLDSKMDNMWRRLPRLTALLEPMQAAEIKNGHNPASRAAWQSTDDACRTMPDENATLVNMVQSAWKSALEDVQGGVAAEIKKFRSEFEASVISQITALSSRVDSWTTQASVGPFLERDCSDNGVRATKPMSASRRGTRDLPQDQPTNHCRQLGHAVRCNSATRTSLGVFGERPKSRGAVGHERCVTPANAAVLRSSQSMSRLPAMKTLAPL